MSVSLYTQNQTHSSRSNARPRQGVETEPAWRYVSY